MSSSDVQKYAETLTWSAGEKHFFPQFCVVLSLSRLLLHLRLDFVEVNGRFFVGPTAIT